MKVKFKILSFLLIFCVMISADNSINCQKIIKLHQNYDCHEQNILYDTKSCNGEIQWTLTNSTLGLVDVEFHPCGNSNFKISLSVQETEENFCDFNGTWKKHSTYNHRRFRSDQDDLPKCSQIAKVQLLYIFSGCYKIEIEAKYGTGYIPKNYSTKYLKTKYSKYIIDGEDITSEHQQRFADNKTDLTTIMKYPQYSKIIQVCFHLENNIDSERLVWNVSCPKENIENICGITIYGQNKNIACNSKTLENNEFIIDCNLFGLVPGSYLFEKYIVNEPIRCNTEQNSVWGNKDCHWEHNLNLTEETFLKIPDNNLSSYLIGISTLVLIVVILILIYFLHKKIQKNRLLKNIPDVVYDPKACDDVFEEILIDPSGILLLYARDCEIFMEVMSSFRRMLQNQEIYEVFDVYDPERKSEILTENQNIWLLRKIMHKNMKIVLVLSECGDYLIENQKSYKDEKCFDSLYNYGVRILLQNSYSFTCNKLFVTKFSFFDESRPTSILSPDRRYHLDDLDNVKILVNALLSNIELEEKNGIFEKCIKFCMNCKRLINFVYYNPNYLTDILEIT